MPCPECGNPQYDDFLRALGKRFYVDPFAQNANPVPLCRTCNTPPRRQPPRRESPPPQIRSPAPERIRQPERIQQPRPERRPERVENVGATSTLNDSSLCQICLARPRDAQFVPCNHHYCCQQCAQRCGSCPVCRASITSVRPCDPRRDTMGGTRVAPPVGVPAAASAQLPNANTRGRVVTLTSSEVRAISTFHHNQRLGHGGGQGDVYQGRWQQRQVAVKLFHRQADYDDEIAAANDPPHDNVIRALASCCDPASSRFAIVYPMYIPLDERHLRHAAHRLKVVQQYAAGVRHLHEHRRCHRDIKPDNCVVELSAQTGVIDRVLVIDLGIAREVPESHRSTRWAGTACFIDPDCQQTGVCRLEHDVYSFAVLIACISSGLLHPNSGNHCLELFRAVSLRSTSLRGLLERMQSPQLQQRPTMDEVCRFLSRLTTADFGVDASAPAQGSRPPTGAVARAAVDTYQQNVDRFQDVQVPLRRSRRPPTIVFTSNGNAADETCVICQTVIARGEPVHATRCNHFFHKDCIDNWWSRSHICPVCRTDLHEHA